jgi:hypothetical protein
MPENMTLRDWFAGMALQGLLASGEAGPAGANDAAGRRNAFVDHAYFYADSMLAKKESPQRNPNTPMARASNLSLP